MTLEQALEKVKSDDQLKASFLETLREIVPGASEIGRVFQRCFIVSGDIKVDEMHGGGTIESTMVVADVADTNEGTKITAWVKKEHPVSFTF